MELEPKVIQYIREHELQIQEALRLYNTEFTGVGDGVTFHAACSRNKMSPSYVTDYMVMHGMVMPDTKEEAQENLHALEKLKIIEQAERLYTGDGSNTAEQLAQETGINVTVFEFIEKGLNWYADPILGKEPENAAKEIEHESSGLVDYQTMLTIIVNFMKKASKVYETQQNSKHGSRRGFANAFNMHWPYYENFYWRNNLSEERGNLAKLEEMGRRIENLEKLIA